MDFDGICLDCTDDGFGVSDTFDEYSGEYRIMIFPYCLEHCIISFADNADVEKAGYVNNARVLSSLNQCIKYFWSFTSVL